MKKKIAITIIGLTVVLSIVACGNKDSLTESTETNSIVEDSETIDTEVVATESVEPTEVQESETEVSDEVADIIAQLEEMGYNNIDPAVIERMQLLGCDLSDTSKLEHYEVQEFGMTLEGEGTASQKLYAWAKSQGADYMLGWTLYYENGSGAGNQPSYGIYVRPGDPRYGERIELGSYTPSGDRITGTREEYDKLLIEDATKQLEEDGHEVIKDEETGELTVIID